MQVTLRRVCFPPNEHVWSLEPCAIGGLQSNARARTERWYERQWHRQSRVAAAGIVDREANAHPPHWSVISERLETRQQRITLRMLQRVERPDGLQVDVVANAI